MMAKPQHSSKPSRKMQSNRLALSFLIIPMISCAISSTIGIVLGQIGNLFYSLAGSAANCLAIPGFVMLFLISFGISYLSSQLLKKWLVK